MMQRINDDDEDIKLYPRHSLIYTARESPFGHVSLNMYNLAREDFTNYTLTVDNGEEEPLIYTFCLNEGGCVIFYLCYSEETV